MLHRFRLQSVLSYRQQRLDALQLELARLEKTYHYEEAVLVAMRARKEAQMAEILNQQASHRIDVPRLIGSYTYLEKVGWDIQRQVELLNSISEQVEQKREEVKVAMQQCKVLENLRERDQRRFTEWLNRVEAAFVDEIATGRHNRRRLAAEEGDGLA